MEKTTLIKNTFTVSATNNFEGSINADFHQQWPRNHRGEIGWIAGLDNEALDLVPEILALVKW